MRSIARLAPLAMMLTLVGPALAEPKPKRAPKAAVEPKALDKKAIAALREKLAGGRDEVVEALVAATKAGPAAAALAPDLEAILRRGSIPELALFAIAALGRIGAPTSAEAVAPYLRHRNSLVRDAAASALGNLPGPVAEQTLRACLHTEPELTRHRCAASLGTIGAKSALPELFLLLEHEDTSSALVAIGQLCEGEDCARLLAKLGKTSFEVMKRAIDPIFFRTPPLPDEVLLGVVASLRELGTAETRRYLTDVAERWPKSGSKRVKQVLEDMLAVIPTGLRGKP